MSWASKAFKKISKPFKEIGKVAIAPAQWIKDAGDHVFGEDFMNIGGAVVGAATGGVGMAGDWSWLGPVATVASGVLNYQAAKDTNDTNVDLWREQAAYNTPAKQVQRWRDAGLNPNLMYGQGTSGNITNLPQRKAPSFDVDFMNQMALMAQIKNIREQNKNIQAQNQKLRAETAGEWLKNGLTMSELNYADMTGLPPSASAGFWPSMYRTGRGILKEFVAPAFREYGSQVYDKRFPFGSSSKESRESFKPFRSGRSMDYFGPVGW
ncbi:DNA pilot protein [Sigmofec virus UA08Rod_6800]|uniref:DNA pilot protein n=1 Tax=Sigmofec virus UA08Rod_6800 TaxID=2929240 RepID=A0A976N127_9VIRU|nr:DNA pilot protein [Sigmofec virus UA08Rod_6800]